MTALTTALLAELSDEDRRALAESLAPILRDILDQSDTSEGWLRGADAIATYIGAPRSRVYALASANRIPVVRDGSALVAQRADLDQWLRSGGGKRP